MAKTLDEFLKEVRADIVECVRRVDGTVMISEESQLVFQSYAGLAEWIGQHFDHRAQEVAKDTHNAEVSGRR